MLKFLEQENSHWIIWMENLDPQFFVIPTNSAEIASIKSQNKN